MRSLPLGNRELLVVGDRVLVEPDDGESTTEVGLLLPAGAVAKETVQSGRVVAVGPGTPLPPPGEDVSEDWQEPKVSLRYVPMQVEVGDYVSFYRKAGIEISVDRKTYLVVPQHAVLVILRDTPAAGVPDGLPDDVGENL